MALSDYFFKKSRPAVVETPTPEPETTPNPIEASNSTRLGKFHKLSDFASLEPHEDEFPSHHSFEDDNFDVSHIVHTSHDDINSQWHNRIFLILRQNDLSLTCLGFSIRRNVVLRKHCEFHAKLTTLFDIGEEKDAAYFNLCVSLDKGTPASNVYLNLKDKLDVPTDSGIKFAILGDVDADTELALKWKMVEIYARSWDLDLQEYGRRISTLDAQVPMEDGALGNSVAPVAAGPGERTDTVHLTLAAEATGSSVTLVAGPGRRFEDQQVRLTPKGERKKGKDREKSDSSIRSSKSHRSAQLVTTVFQRYVQKGT